MAEPAAKKETILIVDDEEDIRNLFIRNLQEENFDFLTAGGGEDALDILGVEHVSLMLCDINMDGMSGIDLLNKVQKQYPELAVIIVSGVDDRNVARMALELGASGYLIKPVPRTSMIIQVMNALRLRDFAKTQEASTRLLLHQEKLAAIGRLAAGIIHELNTPTTYIRGNLQIFVRYSAMLDEYIMQLAANPAAEKRKNVINRIESLVETINEISSSALKGTDRIISIVSSMRGFIVDGQVENAELNLFQPLTDALVLTGNRIKHIGRTRINGWEFDPLELESFLADNSLMVSGNSQRLCQLFVILFNNSIDAWQDCSLKSAKKKPSLLQQISVTDNEEENVVCRVCDNSGGMAEETADQVFKPFFTTKKDGKGTGLGMSICQQIVLEHHGSITLENNPGTGVCWNIAFPRKLQQRLKEKI